MSTAHSRKGFTLIELLVVIGILAVLLSIVLIAINPARQFSQANNTKRRNDVLAILNAVHQYAADNKGALPAGITATAKDVSSTGANICASIMPTYISALPSDPSVNTGNPVTDCTSYDTGYQISQDATGRRITVAAPDAELSESISVTR